GRRTLAGGSAAPWGVAALAWRPPAILEQLDARITDLLRGQSPPAASSSRVVVVDIDERSLAEIGRWPWPRTRLARLLAGVQAQGAEVIAVGMMFPESEAPESDRVLREGLAAGP